MNPTRHPIFENVTLPADAIAYALTKTISGEAHDWRRTYPILAQLDALKMARSATIFPKDCPNDGRDAHILQRIGMPLHTGVAILRAAALGVPDAVNDLATLNPAQWFCLAPVHWHAARDHVKLMALDPKDITMHETRELLTEISPWLSELGWTLHIVSPQTWFVRTEIPFDYHSQSIRSAQSDQLENFLPHGNDLKRWQTLLTEIQMRWFENPVNKAREAARKLPINSLWLSNNSKAFALLAQNAPMFNAFHQQIITPPADILTNTHTHLTWLDQQLAAPFVQILTDKQSTVTFLGNAWQQELSISPVSLKTRLRRMKNPIKTRPLGWLETPAF